MARKSRAAQWMPLETTCEECVVPKAERISTAVYVRLSVENSGKAEGKDVIANQIEICKDYLMQNPSLDWVETYIENGKTGTNFNRPEFNRLMDDIKCGKINCLVVRDLSRFGRDYIEAGTYIERIFPSIGLRFISVKEQYDSSKVDATNGALMIPLQNMINDLYSKDISRKVATAHKTRMSNAGFRKSTLPYGYKLDDTRVHILVDEEVASFVKLMFQWKLEGDTVSGIAEKLQALHAPTVVFQKTKTKVSVRENVKDYEWSRLAVERILKNPMYVGDTVVGRTQRALYKSMASMVWNEQSDWRVFENTHEALVSREDFLRVNKMLEGARNLRMSKQNNTESERRKLMDVFEGKIFCADCLQRLYFKRNNRNGVWSACYLCSSYARKKEQCSRHSISAKELEKKVLLAIKSQVKVALDYEVLLRSLNESEGLRRVLDEHNILISSLQLRVNGVHKKRVGLYEDFVEGVLSVDEYTLAKDTYDKEFERLNSQLESALLRRKRFKDGLSADNKWIKMMRSVSKAKKLTQALVDEYVERVLVYENGDIELSMKYTDVYALTVASVNEVKEVAM